MPELPDQNKNDNSTDVFARSNKIYAAHYHYRSDDVFAYAGVTDENIRTNAQILCLQKKKTYARVKEK